MSLAEIKDLKNNPANKEKLFDAVNKLAGRRLVGQTVTVDQEDIRLASPFPDQQLDSSCGTNMRVSNIRALGILERSSQLGANVSAEPDSVSAFLRAQLHTRVNVDFTFRIQTGVRALGKCRRIARETLDLSIAAAGKVDVAASIVGSNIRLATESGHLLLKFDLDLSLAGRPHGWTVDKVDASKCDIRLAGKIRLLSYCSLVEGKVKKELQRYLDKWTLFKAPKLVEKLEDKLQKKTGDEMAIHLFET